MAGVAFDRESLLDALDVIGAAAVVAGTTLDLAVYGGTALMLASNFRYSSEDVDVAEVTKPWSAWLAEAVAQVAKLRGWSADWLSDAVHFHLSSLATFAGDHLEFGTFPRGKGQCGLRVFVPTAGYMLALKLKAMRINDPVKGEQETDDVRNLIIAANVADVDAAIAILARYFPKSAADSEKQRFFPRHIWPRDANHAPKYPRFGR